MMKEEVHSPDLAPNEIVKCLFVSQPEFEVWHSINDAPYTLRGKIAISALTKRTGHKYEDSKSLSGGKEIIGKHASLSDLYHLQIRGSVSGIDLKLNATLRLCNLQSAGLKEHITFHVDQSGIPYHVDYVVPAATCDSSKKLPAVAAFKPQIHISQSLEGVRPKLEQIVAETKDGKPEKPQSFLQKYWMYLIPIVVIMLMGGGGEEPAPAKK
ncbi:hypothetical protein HDU76_004451 [Blyttiomyces sp. JEL0837]|nr:hypothetical protein HDU76_004451 [Blyttiomyces sp. JEL0837]